MTHSLAANDIADRYASSKPLKYLVSPVGIEPTTT